MSFHKYASVKELQQLSSNPIDLTSEKNFTPERITTMQSSALGWKLLYGAERVDDKVMQVLFSLAKESKAIEKMHSMQSGKTMNEIFGQESEKRAVLHTAMRDFFTDRNQGEIALQASEDAFHEYQKLGQFMKELEEKKHGYTDIIQVGIGGSDLGPRALYIALERYHKPNRRAHFISNVDPDDATSILNKVDLTKTLIVVVSKSGSTLETLTNESFVRERLLKMGLDPKDHLIAVTGKGSPMDNPTKYRKVFYMWDFVGGRYSATSMVGAVMLSFTLGMEDFKQILSGASSMDKHALTEDPSKNLPLLSALLGIWNRNFLHHPTVAIIPYSQALARFPAHLQQLDMESNGKRINKEGKALSFSSGPVIWGEPGTNGQHSFFQLLHQGTDIIPIEFIGFAQSQYHNDVTVENTTSQQKLLANLFAQSIAFAMGKKDANPNKQFLGNRPNRILFAEHLNPKTMGSLLSFYEHKVAFQGFIWGINSFDQEGVQLGKKLAKTILSLFEKGKKGFPLGEAYLQSIKELY